MINVYDYSSITVIDAHILSTAENELFSLKKWTYMSGVILVFTQDNLNLSIPYFCVSSQFYILVDFCILSINIIK